MKSRVAILILIAGCCGLPFVRATSPKLPDDPQTQTSTDMLPSTQEATEQAILPEEPILSTPTPEPASDASVEAVQPLPSGGIAEPTGPTVDENRKVNEAFRAAKTEAEEQPALDQIKTWAFAARTEREKRTLLREYYQSISDYIAKHNPALQDEAEVWAYNQQNRLSRRRTEPDYQSPTIPKSMAGLKTDDSAAKPQATPEETPDALPEAGY